MKMLEKIASFFSKNEKEEKPIEITPSVLSFDDLLKRSVLNVWKLVDLLKIHLIYYKIITGKGLEFDRLREYVEGDDAHMIDWNSLARTTKPFVKVFKEERLLDVVFIVDVSNTMLIGTTELIKNEYASVVAATLGYTAHLIGDKVGLICFSDNIKAMLEPSMGIESVLTMVRLLTQKENYGGGKNWSVLPKTVLETFGRDTFMFVISDFIGYNSMVSDFIRKSANQFKGVVAIMLRDPIDSFIPKGIGYIYMTDPLTGEISLVNADKIRDEYNRITKQEEKRIEEDIIASGADFLKIHTDESFVNAMIRFLRRKEAMEWS